MPIHTRIPVSPSFSGLVSLSLIFQAILNSDEISHVLENLDPDTLYDVTVTAIYPDESESEDLMGSQRTCKPAAPRPPLPRHTF